MAPLVEIESSYQSGRNIVQNSAQPLVTIAIPTYNRAGSFLRQALESALKQTYKNVEIIVSDNCSSDNTETLIKIFRSTLKIFQAPQKYNLFYLFIMLLLTLFCDPVFAQPASPGNLALGQPVSASSLEATRYAPSEAVDGFGTSRWSSLWSDPQWIYVDLGTVYPINNVVLNWEAAFGQVYDIQVSLDTTNWTTVYSEINGDGGYDDIFFAPIDARYVRVYGTQRGTGWGYSLWEFEIYGVAEPSVLTSVSVSPPTATLTVGNTQVFTATGLDNYWEVLDTTFEWTVSGGGTIDINTGLC